MSDLIHLKLTAARPWEDKPMAAPGLTSYRARGQFGWIMIGASDAAQALREAKRSTPSPTDLQVWNGTAYEAV